MSKIPNWFDLLPNAEQIRVMPSEKVERAGQAAHQYAFNVCRGIAGIGHLLACTASNGETGLSESVATDIGWLLETLGELSASLIDTSNELDHRLTKQPRA